MRNNIYNLIVNHTTSGKIDQETAVEMIAMLKQGGWKVQDDIAIIGMSAKLPGARNIREYWDNLENGLDSVKRIPPQRQADTEQYIRFMGIDKEKVSFPEYGYLEDIDRFDCDFFRISPKEASLTDPHQRVFLEEAWKAIEDAGYGKDMLSGSKTGVFLGYSQSPKDLYGKIVYDIDPGLIPISTVGNMQAMTASRISYLLNLKGPALVVDTACSSSLLAVELACHSIKHGQCDMAIAGGVKLNIVPLDDANIRIGIESTDWRTRAFDDTADGSGVGEGAGAVLLKPLKKALKDGDHIYAVIKGSATNHDGTTAGITVPNPSSQTAVIQKAWEEAGIEPESLRYIETHGTGTKLGDPIEIKGIEGAFRSFTDKRQFCAISSVKTNIGHLSEAAGIASLVKMALSLKHKKLPPSMYFGKPHSAIPFADSPLYVNTKLRDWDADGQPRRGGVSGFGMSGTNCHLVLEEAPERLERIREASDRPEVFSLSARTKEALVELLHRYRDYLNACPEEPALADICYTANTGRGSYPYRLAILAGSVGDLRARIDSCLASDLDTLAAEWAFYGTHRIARANSEPRAGEISEEEKHRLSVVAVSMIKQWLESGKTEQAALKELCSAYASGADIPWLTLYEGERRYRLSLPSYPFQYQRCWVEYPGQQDDGPEVDRVAGCFETVWVKGDAANETDASSREGIALLIGGGTIPSRPRLSEQLEQAYRNAELIRISIGDEYAQHGQRDYTIRNTQQDYVKLLEQLDHRRISQIIHMQAMEDIGPIDSLDRLEASQQNGLFSLFYLYQALLQLPIEQQLDLVLITDYAHSINGREPRIKPENATLYGLGKIIAKEHPQYRLRSVDIDSDTDDQALVQEIAGGASGGPYGLAYRSGERYIEQFVQRDLDRTEDEPVVIRDRGVYVITGGTGGIGLEMAKELARGASSVVLALLNRTRLPERAQWDAIIADGKNERLVRRLESIRDIERAGAQVELLTANVADPDELNAALTELRRIHGRIDGVLHGAGIAIDQLLADKREEVMRAVLEPKLQGTWLLHTLTEQDNLDFFVMFSSVATIFSAVTQGDYVAANAYLDAFAHYRRRSGGKTLTINWTTWKETGMAAATGAAVNTIFKTMPTSMGVEGFKDALNKSVSRVLIGELNLERLGITLLDKSSVLLSDELQQIVQQHKRKMKPSGSAAKQKAEPGTGTVRLTGRDDADFNEAEKEIADVCKDVLGYAELDIHDNFFEMGADSILLMRIHSELDKRHSGVLSVADLFEHSSISKLAAYLLHKEGRVPAAGEAVPRQATATAKAAATENNEVAIIGLSFRLPMTETLQDYWNAIETGLDHGSSIPESRRRDIEKFIKFKGYPLNAVDYEMGTYLDDIDKFDYRFFRMSPREASTTDPNHRLFLQTAWHAIEDAGYGGDRMSGTRTGVYLGFASNMVYFHRLISEIEPESEGSSMVGNTASVAAGRLSYLFNLRGPSVIVDTACSSSLTAVHMACKAIRQGECEMAVAGGVKLNLLPIFRKGSPRGIGMESFDGRTRAFDHHSDGTGSGEGVAAILLKPLSQAVKDRDQIYAVIRGSAANQDGSSAGLTAPNPAAQEEVILQAWEDAGVDPETITYMETHGTGTQLGDPIEIQGIQGAFRRYTNKKQFCAVGSAKTNLTHLAEAAGIAGVIRAVLALKHKELPPNAFFNRPNRKIDFSNSPVYVNASRRKWEPDGFPRRCGVSGFGLSGTNCHVVMEEYAYPEAPQAETSIASGGSPQLLALSALTESALLALVEKYCDFPFGNAAAADFRNVCYTANTGRGHYAYRIALIAHDAKDAAAKLAEAAATGFDKMDKPWFAYGFHKVVSASKGKKAKGELSESERIAIREDAERAVERFIGDGRTDAGDLERICGLYAQGADLNWEQFYAGEQLYRVSIPTYPFEKERCWIEIPEFEESAVEVASSGMYFNAAWKLTEELQQPEAGDPEGPILLLMDEVGIGASLEERWRQRGNQTVKVFLGSEYRHMQDGSYMITGAEEDYVRLLKDNKDKKWSKIIHLFSLLPGEKAEAWERFADTQRRGVYSLFYLTKAAAKVGLSAIADTVLVSNQVCRVTGNESQLTPWGSSLFALGRTVRQEMPNLLCRCIDIDENTDSDTVMRELTAAQSTYQVAYRGNARYTEVFQAYDPKDAAEEKPDIREDGVYLITGGTGGMGIETAKYLAADKQVNVALVNRSPLPDRALWDEIIRKNSRMDRKTIERIEAIREVEALGVVVEYYAADVSSYEQMSSVIESVRSRFGRINGIVHGAGVGGDGFLYVKDEQVFDEVVRPKVFGTWILDRLTEVDRPDFFIMNSSMSARFAVQGQGDYCAANAFLDAYADYRSLLGKKTLSINWVAWKDRGMAVEFGVNADGAFKAIPTSKAIRGLDEALNRRITNVLIGEMNYGSDVLWELGLVPQRMEPHLEAAVAQSRRRWEARQQAAQRKVDGELKLSGKDGEYTDLEEKLAAIFCEVLGSSEIDIYDNFFELGGDSILLGRVHAALDKLHPGRVKLLDLFEHTSVYKLYQFLTQSDEEEAAADLDGQEQLETEPKLSEEQLEEDTKRLLDQLEKGSLSIEEAIGQLTKRES